MKPFLPNDPEIIALNSSFAFRLSLAAKELFHSNILAWALMEFPRLCGQLFGVNAPLSGGKVDPGLMRVRREAGNLDLVVEIITKGSTGQCTLEVIVVENKLKAIPTREQLDEYAWKAHHWTTNYRCKPSEQIQDDFDDEGHKGDGYLSRKPTSIHLWLLAPTCPYFFSWNPSGGPHTYECTVASQTGRKAKKTSTTTSYIWKYKSYADWTRELATLSRGVGLSHAYASDFVDDYCKHLDDGLLKLITVDRNDILTSAGATTIPQVLTSRAYDRVAKQQRIHDLLGKVTYDEIAHLVAKKMDPWFGGNTSLESYSGWTMGQPLFGFQFVLAQQLVRGKRKHIAIGVQVQAGRYRRFISKNFDGDWTLAPFKGLFLSAINDWMLATHHNTGPFPFGQHQIEAIGAKTREPVKVPRIPGGSNTGLAADEEPFEFGRQRFRYLRLAIPNQCAIECLVNEVVRDMVLLASRIYKSTSRWPVLPGCDCPSNTTSTPKTAGSVDRGPSEVDRRDQGGVEFPRPGSSDKVPCPTISGKGELFDEASKAIAPSPGKSVDSEGA